MELDETDRKILNEYLKDARLSYREIAKRINVAVGTVLSRTKKMEQEGVIKGYTVVLDDEKLGYMLTAVTEVTVSKGRLVEVEKEIAKLNSTCAVYDVTGLTDAFIIGKFRSRSEISAFTKALLALPYVERTNTHLVLSTIKEDFRRPP
ncbi:MAG: Lrp/AsnC family transcriptional regulator [Thaumarchaeota archaeon]|nr:Lrp/AsnC family transcriptional regulator [Nitrososphaerota archaeon]MCL5319112.1 Lrp/AsnC family transcriptional regulator [Nitrososphaerota archaeon]